MASRFEMEQETRRRNAILEEANKRFAAENSPLTSAPFTNNTFTTGNGPQDGFTTGATRSSSEGKVDFEGHISPDVEAVFGDYMNRHRVQRDGKVRASDNWQQGIPLYRYMKSLIRHVFEFWRMWRGTEVVNPDSGQPFTFEDVLCAIKFNVNGLIFEMLRQGRGEGSLLGMTYLPRFRREELEAVDMPKKPTHPDKDTDVGATVPCACQYCRDTRKGQ